MRRDRIERRTNPELLSEEKNRFRRHNRHRIGLGRGGGALPSRDEPSHPPARARGFPLYVALTSRITRDVRSARDGG